MTSKNKLDLDAVVNEVFALMLQFEQKNMIGRKKKEQVLMIIKSHYNLTEEYIELIDNFIDIIILFYKVNKSTKCFKCF